MFFNFTAIIFLTAILTGSFVTLAKTFQVTYEFKKTLTKGTQSGPVSPHSHSPNKDSQQLKLGGTAL